MTSLHILLVDDDDCVREALADVLRSSGYAVVTASDGNQALDRFHDQVGAIVTDMQMPECDGAQFLALLSERTPRAMEIPVVVTTGTPEIARARMGDHPYRDLTILAKPFALPTLIARLKPAPHGTHPH